jgi:hypothetical protein
MQTELVETPNHALSLLGASIEGSISVIFLVLFVIWALYTLIAGYHWLRYGHRSIVAIPALIIHVVVSWLLAGYAVSGIIG